MNILLGRYITRPATLLTRSYGTKTRMSFAPSYKYISAEELAEMIKTKSAKELKEFAVVDVRDSDFVGGNIVAAVNVPSDTFHDKVQGLVEKFDQVEKVVFHCALSQARGPKAARIYAETRKEVAPDAKPQEVYILRDGFSGFQARYRNDPELVEKFNKYYHD